MKKDSIGYVVLFTFIVCAVFVLGLAVANEVTKSQVEANKRFAAQSAVLDTLGIAYADRDEAETLYKQRVQPVEGAVPRAYRATIDGTDYVVVEHSGAGLWGTITIVLAADPAGSRIKGVRVISQLETPGLGGRIEEPWFLGQFVGERTESGRVAVTTGAEAAGGMDSDKENAKVDGISGASRTSASMDQIISGAIARVIAVAGGTK
jgi:Na+-transporting NADH:ubiquinone oxidoreductase subunit C